jgi:hypothetical protein
LIPVAAPVVVKQEVMKSNIDWRAPDPYEINLNRTQFANEHGYGQKFLETHDLLNEKIKKVVDG